MLQPAEGHLAPCACAHRRRRQHHQQHRQHASAFPGVLTQLPADRIPAARRLPNENRRAVTFGGRRRDPQAAGGDAAPADRRSRHGRRRPSVPRVEVERRLLRRACGSRPRSRSSTVPGQVQPLRRDVEVAGRRRRGSMTGPSAARASPGQRGDRRPRRRRARRAPPPSAVKRKRSSPLGGAGEGRVGDPAGRCPAPSMSPWEKTSAAADAVVGLDQEQRRQQPDRHQRQPDLQDRHDPRIEPRPGRHGVRRRRRAGSRARAGCPPAAPASSGAVAKSVVILRAFITPSASEASAVVAMVRGRARHHLRHPPLQQPVHVPPQVAVGDDPDQLARAVDHAHHAEALRGSSRSAPRTSAPPARSAASRRRACIRLRHRRQPRARAGRPDAARGSPPA